MILQITTDLLEPEILSEPLALVIISMLLIFAYIALKLQHALLMIAWFITIVVLGNVILVGLEFIWFWIMVMIMGGITAIAAMFRFFVVPSRQNS